MSSLPLDEISGRKGRPVARRAAPALQVRSAHAFVQLVSTREDRAFAPVMTLVGCYVPDRAVAVRAVVPIDEASHPAVRGREVGEGQDPEVERWEAGGDEEDHTI